MERKVGTSSRPARSAGRFVSCKQGLDGAFSEVAFAPTLEDRLRKAAFLEIRELAGIEERTVTDGAHLVPDVRLPGHYHACQAGLIPGAERFLLCILLLGYARVTAVDALRALH